MNKYKIADVIVEVTNHSQFSQKIMADYEYKGNQPADLTITVTDDMIEYEKIHCNEVFHYHYYETTAICRSVCMEVLKNHQGFFFHCSSLEYDNKAFLFTAPSGTGKSTHAKLWQQHFGSKVTMINDDKPIIKRENGKFYIYGTPWQGKSNIGNNIKVPVHAICILSQGKENVIEKIDPITALTYFMEQTERPKDKESMEKLMDLLGDFIIQIPVYKMSCNISEEAVTTAFNAMI